MPVHNDMNTPMVTLAHGAGGRAMSELIDELFLEYFHNTLPLEDQARIPLSELVHHGSKLAFTTDSYVVDPLFFKGGDIGSLAVNGTVNDLAVGGAKPLYLSCSFILEEGLAISELKKIIVSMRRSADRADVKIVTGDTKVVPTGAVDKVFINTSGVGVIADDINWSVANITAGDAIIVNNTIGDHGVAILSARGDLGFDADVSSDCRSLNEMCLKMSEQFDSVHAVRDATRGGVASVLNEMASASKVSITLEESAIPIKDGVKATCEMLGLDPLYLANEGLMVVATAPDQAQSIVDSLKKISGGEQACIIGYVESKHDSGEVQVKTVYSTRRRLDLLHGDQLPRIC